VADVGLVHLVRRRNGIGPFERFLASYRGHRAGVAHDLVVVFKGFGAARNTAAYDRALADIPHRRIYVADRGFDLGPYFKAVAMLEHRYLCFLNSFSRVLDDDWLAKLHRWACADGVGVAAATGSYQSFASGNAERERPLERLSWAGRVRSRTRHVFSAGPARVVALRAAASLLGPLGVWNPARYFPPFPNCHVRTNAFMSARATLARIRVGPMILKLSAFMFESGRHSLTNQLLSFGLRPIVVGRDGAGYEKEDWHRADTYRQSRQENLLVADNQTDLYAEGNERVRAELSRIAWGHYARPG
jgi:hypothetical protein